MIDKLSIANEMTQFDCKNRNFYNDLTDEERKKFSNFLMIRWGSSIQGSAELQHYYLQSSNHYVNKHFFAINRHPKLQWLCATAVSPGLGAQRHQWIAPKKKETGASGIRKQITELFPHLKDDEVELMYKINTKKDIDAYVKQLGQEVKK